jgi:secondary thiamine-phosphate synthase enzyme
MVATSLLRERLRSPSLRVCHDRIRLRTRGCLEFVDVTDDVLECVRQSGVRDGIVNVQSRHTTAAIVVNEPEPLLLDDMRRTLERLAPRDAGYEHDDMERREGPLPPDEPINGHSHCKALFLNTAATLNIVDGEVDLGTWQHIFLVELCSPRNREISVTIMGDPA